MVTRYPPKTREQLQAERLAEIDAIQQMQLRRDAEQAARRAEQAAFEAKVQERRDRIDSYIRRSWAQRSDVPMGEHELAAIHAQIEREAFELNKVTVPTLAEIHEAKRAEEQAAAEAAEAARIAALTPREVWMSTLPWQEQQRIAKWEAINKGQQWPYAPV